MRRKRAPDVDGRTLCVALLSLVSTATLERSCPLGALYSVVRTLRRRMLTKIGGEVNMDQQMTGVKEQKAGYTRKHQKSANNRVSIDGGAGERLTNLALNVWGRDRSAKPSRRRRSFLRGKRAVVQAWDKCGQRLWRHGSGRRGSRAVAVRRVRRPRRGSR